MAKLKRKLKKTTIGAGKQIVPWVERLNYFNDYFRPEGYSTTTEIIDMNDSIIVMIGKVLNSDKEVVADGVAHKNIREPFSFQKCQSGALNRALFIFGINDSAEDTIMDEDEAKELQKVKSVGIDAIFNDMLEHIKIDYSVVEQRLPAYKNQMSSDQISTLKKSINAQKSKVATSKATK